jgi:hypothetical protein
MSDLKMCNKHGGVFATDEDGWAKLTGEIHHLGENEFGAEQEFTEHITWHFCGACMKEMRVTGRANRRKQYIAELERENNIPPYEKITGAGDTP